MSTLRNKRKVFRAIFFICALPLLFLVLHELGLKINPKAVSGYQNSFWSYYPASPRLIFPENAKPITSYSEIDTVQLNVEHSDLFSFFNGIHTLGYHFFLPNHIGTDWWNWNANYHQRGKRWEKPARISMKLANGEVLRQEPLGIRINGNTSRAFPQKSFRLCFREQYGLTQINSPFAEDSGFTYHTLVLRNHGANWGNLYSIDALVHNSIPRRDIVLKSKPVVVMLNNEFWGVYHLRSKIKLNKKEKSHGKEIIKPSTKEYALFCGHLDSLMSLQNDSALYCIADDFIDLNTLQYMVFTQVLFGNQDWPYDNVLIESSKTSPSKFYVKDLDLAFTKPIPNGGFQELYAIYKNVFIQLHNRLLQHPDYQRDFQLLVNKYFKNRCFENAVKESVIDLKPLIEQQSARWTRYTVEEIEHYPSSVLDSFQMRKKRYLEYLEGV